MDIRIKKINTAAFFIVSITGIICAISIASSIGGFIGFLAFIGISIISLLLAFVSVATIMVFLDLAEDIAIIKHLMLKDNVSDNSTHMVSPEKRNGDLLKNGGWRCNECNKVNASYIGTCSCGNSKSNNC